MSTSPVVERWTTRSGVRIRFLDNAPVAPAGLPILFVPGFTDFADEYAEVLDHFATASARRLLVVEVRGRGGSDSPALGFRAADHAADLRAVLDEVGIDRFHLMTFSRGTTWALDLLLAEPALVATVAIGDYWAREHALGADAAETILATRFRGRPIPERIERRTVEQVFAASEHRDLCGALAWCGVPVLVATGTLPGCLLGPEELEEFRRRVPRVEIAVVDGAAHDLFRPDRLAYSRAVSAFIERRTPGL